MTFGERIVASRSEAGINQRQLAEMLGISPTRLNYWEKDKRQPDVPMIKALAQALGATGDYLIDNNSVQHKNTPTILTPIAQRIGRAYEKAPEREQGIVDHVLEPYIDDEPNIIRVDFRYSVYNKASAGTGFPMGDEYLETIRVRLDALPNGYEKDPSRYFGVPVAGDSMEPEYFDGDTLIVCDAMANVGDIVLVMMDGEGYVKRLGAGVLKSINPAYGDIPLKGDVRLCGKVVGTLDMEAIE